MNQSDGFNPRLKLLAVKPCMTERMKAIMFYRTIFSALNTNGVKRVVVTLDTNGEMEAHVES